MLLKTGYTDKGGGVKIELLTKEIVDNIPNLYETDGHICAEKIVYARYFFPVGRAAFYATEYSPTEKLFFGYMISPLDDTCDEWGYLSLKDMEEPIPINITINDEPYTVPYSWERDMYFEPKKVGEIDEIRCYDKSK
jgi:hypothetical protein